MQRPPTLVERLLCCVDPRPFRTSSLNAFGQFHLLTALCSSLPSHFRHAGCRLQAITRVGLHPRLLSNQPCRHRPTNCSSGPARLPVGFTRCLPRHTPPRKGVRGATSTGRLWPGHSTRPTRSPRFLPSPSNFSRATNASVPYAGCPTPSTYATPATGPSLNTPRPKTRRCSSTSCSPRSGSAVSFV